MTDKVLQSLGPVDSGRRVDKDAMIELLNMGSFKKIKERDLDLYILEGNAQHGRILVLDNDLAIYNTSAGDIGLRKSPTVKEMVRIRNIKKILNDSDVVIGRKEVSVKTIQKACIEMLDLSFEPSDIEALAEEGSAALTAGDVEGVREVLTLFAELLGYRQAPKPFKTDGYEIMGRLDRAENGEILLSPVVIFGPSENSLKLMDVTIGSFDKEKINSLRQVVKGTEDASLEGPEVFQYLKEAVFRTKRR